MHYRATDRWLFDFHYSWFDFAIRELDPGTVVHANAPEHTFSFSSTYRKDSFLAALRYRWVDDYMWTASALSGPVPAHEVVDLNATYDFSDRWQVGLVVSNLLDNGHIEAFGGSVLRRRAVATVAFSW